MLKNIRSSLLLPVVLALGLALDNVDSQVHAAPLSSAPLLGVGGRVTDLVKYTLDLTTILTAADPFKALGQTLSNSSNPDPIPAVSGTYSLVNTSATSPLPDALKQTFIQKTLQYSSAVYCPSVLSGSWTCGPYCDANPQFQLQTVGGDGGNVQFFFVGWNPPTKEIVVTHQGANTNNISTYLYLVDFPPAVPDQSILTTLSRVSYPRSQSNVPVGLLGDVVAPPLSGPGEVNYTLVAGGAQTAWLKQYPTILTAVQQLYAAHPDTARVFVNGHSLGAVAALYSGLALRSVVPTSIPIEVSRTAPIREGNPVFAELVDALTASPAQNFTNHHTIHYQDSVPHLFPLVSGYQHTGNEIWITNSDKTYNAPAVTCPGRENVNCALSQGLTENLLDHPGPYWGVLIGNNCTR
ncbi:hypothetical protein OC845_005778 [Tilletia horrida]|nr:hypothetical protein OC845_005778 [Tilletia horrida]